MRKYTAKLNSNFYYEDYIYPVRLGETVFEEDIEGPVPIGVLDSQGEMIYAYEMRNPIGFYPLKEDE